MVEQQVGLGRLEPVQFLHDAGLSGLGGRVEHRQVRFADAVVVVVEPVHLAEDGVDPIVVGVVVPVLGNGLLVAGTQYGVGLGVDHGHA
ncbi:hypothetical protein ACTD5D_28975 [Nocardia takedensis]|uniref:hypothetical protein n=1 Tax=Nocardia takedensis TaxID=259390 RepID=UPI003F773EB7